MYCLFEHIKMVELIRTLSLPPSDQVTYNYTCVTHYMRDNLLSGESLNSQSGCYSMSRHMYLPDGTPILASSLSLIVDRGPPGCWFTGVRFITSPEIYHTVTLKLEQIPSILTMFSLTIY